MKTKDYVYCKLCDKRMEYEETLTTHLFKYHTGFIDQYFEVRPWNWRANLKKNNNNKKK